MRAASKSFLKALAKARESDRAKETSESAPSKRKATKTLIKREAKRVFGEKVDVLVAETGIGWECVAHNAPKGVSLRQFALTKQGALQDAFEVLSGLERRT